MSIQTRPILKLIAIIIWIPSSSQVCAQSGDAGLGQVNHAVRGRGERPADPEAVAAVLAAWGSCPAPCIADINHDSRVDQADLLEVLTGIGLVKDGSPPPGFTVVEGDIQMPLDKATFTLTTWPNGRVPYEFDSNMNTSMRNRAILAMDRWANVANLTFVASSDELAFLHFQNATANNAPLGWGFGQRTINLTTWTTYAVEHEIGHALGFYHEQSRYDRNTYVTINTDNIQSGQSNNFALRSLSDDEYGPYDFDSVMHYDKCSFSTGCPPGQTCACPPGTETIIVKAPWTSDWQDAIGQRDHLSAMDQMTMSFLYPETDWRFTDTTYGGVNQLGSFRQPMRTVLGGVAVTPVGGSLYVQPGSYAESITIAQTIRIEAPLGGVTIGQ